MASGILTTISEFTSFQGSTGTYRSTDVQNALLMAESKVSNWLNSPLLANVITEEYPWPVDDGKIMLEKVRLVSITSITALHTQTCTCGWTEVADCAYILNAKQSIIQVIDCQGVGNRCWPCRCPKRVRVTYTAGFSSQESDPNTPDGFLLRSSIFTAALGFLQSTIGLDAVGNLAIGSWSSAGYSESRQFNERSGTEEMVHPLIQQAKDMCRSLRIKRSPIFQRMKKGTMY